MLKPDKLTRVEETPLVQTILPKADNSSLDTTDEPPLKRCKITQPPHIIAKELADQYYTFIATALENNNLELALNYIKELVSKGQILSKTSLQELPTAPGFNKKGFFAEVDRIRRDNPSVIILPKPELIQNTQSAKKNDEIDPIDEFIASIPQCK